MATSSILGGDRGPEPIAGKGTDALGPSDNSDSGSDAQGAYGDGELASDSDAAGTGERASIEGMDRADADILPDHVERDASFADDNAFDDADIDADDLDDLDALALDEEVEIGDEDADGSGSGAA